LSCHLVLDKLDLRRIIVQDPEHWEQAASFGDTLGKASREILRATVRINNLKDKFVKWLVFVVALAAVLPVAGWLRRNPRQHRYAWMLMGFLPFMLTAVPGLEIAPIGWPEWQGMTKGAEISALDLLALCLYLGLPRAQHPLPFRLSMALYLATVLISALVTAVPVATLFYAWQLARMFLVYAVVTRACADDRVVPSLLKGMALGLCFEASLTIWDRYGLGLLQAGGGFGHQNLLGLVSHFVVFPFLALLLVGQRGWQPLFIPLVGAIIAVLTASRATIGLAGLGGVALFVISSFRMWTTRKAKIALIGAAFIGLFATLALSSLERRFAEDPLQDGYDERALLMNAAGMMLSDHPLGVGANNFVVVANLQGYDERAGVAWTSRQAIVHNIYWLAAAETGYLGVMSLVILLFRPLATAFMCGWRNRRDPRGDLLLGFGMSMAIVYTHSFFEWIFFSQEVQYLFAMTVGMVAGLARQLSYRPSFRVQPSFVDATRKIA
jgi:O-antigen ligase